ncbi:MAG: HEAT repeat domain-containing protein [bacterium]|nr:HEAT repeat domain-containing protein [bacterium]
MKFARVPREDPSPALRDRFYATLEAYRQGMEDSRPAAPSATKSWWQTRPLLQWAAALGLLIIGLSGGLLISGGENGATEMAMLRGEVSSMRQLVTLALLKQESASERLRAVSVSQRLEDPEDNVLSALLAALDSDPSVNVRLAAVDAISRFADRTPVKRRLLTSLSQQQSPLVQIELVDLLAELRDRESLSAIRTLGASEDLDPVVRQKVELVLQ